MALVRRVEGKILLIKRAKGLAGAGNWTPLSGRPEPGETLEQTAIREAHEEVGLRVIVGREVHRCPSSGGDWMLVWLDARPAEGADPDALTLQASEVEEARWVTVDEALLLEPMYPATRAFLTTLVPSRREAP